MRSSFGFFTPLLFVFFWSPFVFAEGDYTLTVSEISVKETKQNGHAWDTGLKSKKPDIYIVLSVDHTIILEHSFVKDQAHVLEQIISASFNMNEHAPSRVHVDIIDQDLKHNDLIDSLDFDLSSHQLNEVIILHSDMVLSFKFKLSHTRAGEAIQAQKKAQSELLICQKELQTAQATIKELKAKLQEALNTKQKAEESVQKTLQAKLSAEKSVRALNSKLDQKDSVIQHMIESYNTCDVERKACPQKRTLKP